MAKSYTSGYRRRRHTCVNYQKNPSTKLLKWSTTRCLKVSGSLSESWAIVYVIILIDLERTSLATANLVWSNLTPETIDRRDATRAVETVRRHAIEMHDKDLTAVHLMEKRLNISDRWMPESGEWKAAAERVSMRQFQRCLDSLEGLVVARMFELTRMNMSQTGKQICLYCPVTYHDVLLLLGYNLRKHIGKALKSRSVAIRTALLKYNAAAANLRPPRQQLTWEEVVEYAFLADFDLLRDTRQDIRTRPWSTPAARLAIDSYFKLLRAEEEIIRLNVEIPRFLTFMRDEDAYLASKGEEVGLTDPGLAYQIHLQRNSINRFTPCHVKTLNDVGRLQGFNGSLTCGVHIVEPSAPPLPSLSPLLKPTEQATFEDDHVDIEAELEEEQAGEDEEQVVMGAYCSILEFTYDKGTGHSDSVSRI